VITIFIQFALAKYTTIHDCGQYAIAIIREYIEFRFVHMYNKQQRQCEWCG